MLLSFALHYLAVAGEFVVTGRRRSTGGCEGGLGGRRMGSHAAKHEPDQNAACGERKRGDEPERRIRVDKEDSLTVLLHERGDDIGIRLTLLLLFEDFGPRGFTEMALMRGHIAVQVFLAGTALALDVFTDAFHIGAGDLGFGLSEHQACG